MSRVCSSPLGGIYIVLIVIPLITLFSILIANDSLARNTLTFSPSFTRFSSEQHGNNVLSPDVVLRNRIAEVSERIKHAEMLNQERKTEILLLRARLNSLLQSTDASSPVPPVSNNSQFLSPSLQTSSSYNTLQREGSYSLIHSDFVQLPSLSSFLPHLLVPFFQVSERRTFGQPCLNSHFLTLFLFLSLFFTSFCLFFARVKVTLSSPPS